MSSNGVANGSSSTAPIPEWLCLGVEQAGKSCLIKCIKQMILQQQSSTSSSSASGNEDLAFAYSPTNGIERDRLQLDEHHGMIMKEVGGSMKTTWSSYFRDCAGVLFVIDVANSATFSTAIIELASLLLQPQLKSSDFIIALHKQDAPGAFTRTELQASMRLDDILIEAANTSTHTSSGTSKTSNTTGTSSDSNSRDQHRNIAVVETSATKGTGVREIIERLIAQADR